MNMASCGYNSNFLESIKVSVFSVGCVSIIPQIMLNYIDKNQDLKTFGGNDYQHERSRTSKNMLGPDKQMS